MATPTPLAAAVALLLAAPLSPATPAAVERTDPLNDVAVGTYGLMAPSRSVDIAHVSVGAARATLTVQDWDYVGFEENPQGKAHVVKMWSVTGVVEPDLSDFVVNVAVRVDDGAPTHRSARFSLVEGSLTVTLFNVTGSVAGDTFAWEHRDPLPPFVDAHGVATVIACDEASPGGASGCTGPNLLPSVAGRDAGVWVMDETGRGAGLPANLYAALGVLADGI